MYIDPPSPNVPDQMIEDSDDPEPIENTINMSQHNFDSRLLDEHGELFSRYESEDFMLEARAGPSDSDQYRLPNDINERKNSDILNQALTMTDLPPTSSGQQVHRSIYHSTSDQSSLSNEMHTPEIKDNLRERNQTENDTQNNLNLTQSRDQILRLPGDQQYILLQGSSEQLETYEEPFYHNPSGSMDNNLHALQPGQAEQNLQLNGDQPRQILTVDPSQLSIDNSGTGTIIIEAPAGLPASQLHQILENAGVGQCLSKSGPGPAS